MKKIRLKVNSNECSLIVKSLIELKNNLINENRDTTPVDELLLKVIK